MAAAALEANVNEIIGDILDNSISLTENRTSLVKNIKSDRSGSILPKYRKLALVLDKAPNTGGAAWSNADMLAQFRNRFIHFTPAWDHEKEIHDGDFVKQLKKRVPIAKAYESSFMFPYGFMTYGCA
jgi:hypothetical protein